MNLPKGISVSSITFQQEADSCDEPYNVQYLDVTVEDAGGGQYYVIKTERWAVDDPKDLLVLLETLPKFKEDVVNE